MQIPYKYKTEELYEQYFKLKELILSARSEYEDLLSQVEETINSLQTKYEIRGIPITRKKNLPELQKFYYFIKKFQKAIQEREGEKNFLKALSGKSIQIGSAFAMDQSQIIFPLDYDF